MRCLVVITLRPQVRRLQALSVQVPVENPDPAHVKSVGLGMQRILDFAADIDATTATSQAAEQTAEGIRVASLMRPRTPGRHWRIGLFELEPCDSAEEMARMKAIGCALAA